MRKLYIFGLIAVTLVVGLAWADQVTISTYYPAPYGVYRTMKVNVLHLDPVDSNTFNFDSKEDATIICDTTDNTLKRWDSTAAGGVGHWVALGGGGNPVGSVTAHMGATVPDGWLECNGASVSTSSYPMLFAAIGYAYGGGGSFFNLPDLRGYFLRGWDNGAGVDPDAASRTNRGDGVTGSNVGTKQTDAFKSHAHTISTKEDSHGAPKNQVAMGNYSATYPLPSTNTAGGSETRPANIYVMYIIKTD